MFNIGDKIRVKSKVKTVRLCGLEDKVGEVIKKLRDDSYLVKFSEGGFVFAVNEKDLELVECSCNVQIRKLGDFILKEIPGEPSQSEGAGDCAIRLLQKYKSSADFLSELRKVFSRDTDLLD